MTAATARLESPLVPTELRAQVAQLWPIADRLTAAFGTRAGRASKLWRLPARVLWWVCLIASRRGTAVQGNAALCVIPATTGRDRAHRWLLWPITVASVVNFGYAMVILQRSSTITAMAMLAWTLAVVVEFAPAYSRAVRRRSATRRTLTQLSDVWTGPVVKVGMLVGGGDAGLLGRAWLRHADQIGVAVIVDARTARLARVYSRAGFQSAAGDPAALYRLPAAAARPTGTG